MIETLLTNFAAEDAETATGLAALGLDGKAFLIQLGTFLLVYLVLRKFVFGRVVDMLEKRRTTIEEGVRLTSEMQAEKEKLEQDIAIAHKDARKQADEVITASQEQASAIVKKAEEDAQTKADKILAEAKQKITEETLRAKRGLEKDMVELVISATEQVTREKLDASKDRTLISTVLKEQA